MPKEVGYPPKKKVEHGGGSGRSGGYTCEIPPRRSNAPRTQVTRRKSASRGRRAKTNRR